MEQISAAFLTEECSAILQNKIPPKLGDLRSFLIPCKLENSVEYLALADLGARVDENMLVQVGKFMFPVDFVILQMEEDDRVSLILGRPLLHTADAIIRVKNKELNLGIGEDRATFHIDKAMQHSHVNDNTCFRIDDIDEITEDELVALLDDFKPFLNTSEKISETSLDKEFDEFISTNDLELKPLPKHLEYAFLEENSLLPVVISALLEQNEKEQLVSVLKNHKEAFSWKTYDILGISPSFCKHKINFKDDVKLVIQRQRRLNPKMKEVVKKEIIKLLDACIIYDIKDIPWDQMLERLAGNKFFCFLDGFSGYYQIPIEPADQEKTTFTCPYGTYAYKRMPFGLCNAPTTFQRCTIAIFQDMLETSMEVFMDDFSVFGDSFNSWLNNLE
ncbi:reverse transcriptase domain-containing protein [Tanacetum coccineum]